MNSSCDSQITLKDINEKLKESGFPLIHPTRARDIIPPSEKDRFIRCVFLANTDLESANYVAKVLSNAGITAQEPESNSQYQDADGEEKPDSSEGKNWESFHVYGAKAALCFSSDITKGETHTIALEAASSIGPKSYDWQGKIRIQITKSELPVVAAVLMGIRNECEFKNHGKNNDKGFSMKRQEGGKIFVSVFAKGQPAKAVPIFQPDMMWATGLVVQQLQKNFPGIDTMGVISMLKATQAGV